MNVTDRLRRLTKEKNPALISDKEEKIADLRRRIETILERRRSTAVAEKNEPRAEPLALMLATEGEEIENTFGRVFVAHGRLEAASFHGRRRIRELPAINMPAVAILAKDSRLTGLKPEDALFLDTETTGLAGGTGTLAFLIGLGWYQDESFVTRQIFLRDFTEEPAGLLHLLHLAADKKWLVTFNGKAFDLGLLTTRYVLNRLDAPFLHLPHLDLLHPSRRILRHRLENSRLVTVEQEVLGLRREGDIPGEEIPERYFEWLRYRDARLMKDVLEHNRLDVVSMATLTIHLADLVGHGLDAEDFHHGDLLAVARLQIEHGNPELAENLLTDLIHPTNGPVAVEAARLLSLIYKRTDRHPQAVDLWEQILQFDAYDFFAIEELAKWYEHHQKDYAAALDLVRRCLFQAPNLNQKQKEDLQYRLFRLEHRAERTRR